MKKLLACMVFGVLFLLAGQVSAQTTPTKGVLVDAEISKLKYGSEGNFFVVDYEIPFEGMMEIRIFNDQEELIWQEQYINGSGANKIRLKASAFEAGMNYTLQLNYKRDEIKKKVKIG